MMKVKLYWTPFPNKHLLDLCGAVRPGAMLYQGQTLKSQTISLN